MKIAWFTPITKKSAIGKIGAMVCAELAKSHRVDIWAPRCEDPIETEVPVIQFSPDDIPGNLESYDAVFYNLGNFAGYHREILEASRKFPGILILHDQTMASFWGQYHCVPEFGGDATHGVEAYRAMVGEYYGDQAASAVDQAVQSGTYPFYAHESLEGYDFLAPTVAQAEGIFTHSGFFARRLAEVSNRPIGYSYLPCALPEEQKTSPALSDLIGQAKAEGRKILVSSGIVHPVKRIHKVTDCLRTHRELAHNICYLVIGSCDGAYGDELRRLELGELKGCLHMLGYQPDEVMEAALSAADLAINLRYPNSEVCSLSLWEQMSYGKPVLVLNRGVYGEVPAETVVRIPLEQEGREMAQVLQDLVDGTLDRSIGTRARTFIRENCDVAVYCKNIVAFAETVRQKAHAAELQERVLRDLAGRMSDLHLSEKAVPATYAAIIDQVAKVFGSQNPDAHNKVMAIWMGFPYHVPNLNREGVSRLMGYLVSSMLRYYPDVSAEIWCYSFNEEEARITFESVRKEDRARIRFLTEKNWAEELGATPAQVRAVGEISSDRDELIAAVRTASKASVLIPLIIYLDRVTESGKRIFVPGYDMAVAEHYEEFVEKDPCYMARNSDYIWRAENLATRNSVFFSNSGTVRDSQILKYVRGLNPERSKVVYIPPNIPEYSAETLIPEQNLREQFSLKGPYLFYPTQIRPYKNVSTLIRAFALLVKEYPELKLVLTGTPSDVPDVEKALRETGAEHRVLLLKNLTETELYSVYHYAAAVPVTSVFEGGFHYQAMEGLFQSAPIVVADIPVVRERIRSFGFKVDEADFPIFSPKDPEDLARCLRTVLEDRPAALERQREFAHRLMSYTWKEAVQQYYELFFGETERASD